MDPRARQLRKNILKIALIVFAGMCILILSGVSFYFYGKYRQSQKDFLAKAVQKDPSKDVIAEVGRIMQLPQGEEPTVATVTNASDLKKQQFFKTAQNGDKVLIYTNAKRAILYRPSTKKIVDVAPINLPPLRPSGFEGQASTTTASPALQGSVAGAAIAPSVTPTPTVYVYPTAEFIPQDTSTPVPTQ